MDNLKTLYNQARKGRSSDVSSYLEAVKTAFDDPIRYIHNLEYIISSSAGLNTLKPFIEKYGLPIAAYGDVTALLEKCINKCKNQEKNSSAYEEALSYMESFKNKYHGAFDMFDYYNEAVESNYIDTFYGNTKGVQNRLLAAGMIDKFNEAAYPDLIIAADNHGSNACAKLEKYINESDKIWDSMFCEWVDYACTGTGIHPNVKANKLSSIVGDLTDRQMNAYRESVIMNAEREYEYTKEEVDSIQKLIEFKEFVLAGMDNASEEALMEAQRDIYALYESFGDLFTEEDADIVQLLPESVGSLTSTNTSDKKTGKPAPYIANNHDMAKWGEEDEPEKKENEPKTLDDYKRPSTKHEEEIKPYEGEPEPTPAEAAKEEKERQQAIQNYYYYTYNNSLNRSSKDDHSVRNDYSQRTDDHSVGKRINSNNNDPTGKKDEYYQLESSKPWTLNLGFAEPFMEHVLSGTPSTAAGKKEYENLCTMLGRQPNHEYELDVPTAVHVLIKNDDGSVVNSLDFSGVRFARVFDDNGAYITTDGFEEIPLAVYLINKHGEEDFIHLPILNTLKEAIKSLANVEGIECPDDIMTMMAKFEIKPNTCFLKPDGNIGFSFESNLDPEHGVGINFDKSGKPMMGDASIAFESVIMEAVGNDGKPQSDHPLQDALMDLDKETAKIQQGAKRTIQNIQNTGRAVMKPINRTKSWINNMISNWKDADETKIKERMADPHSRNNLFHAIKLAIEGGALLKAGILLNPIFLFLGLVHVGTKSKREMRLRNEMIGELKTELSIIDEKIKDADQKNDNKAKYELMRFKNELKKKLLRVGGGKGWSKLI